MLLLGLDTSAKHFSIALYNGTKPVAEIDSRNWSKSDIDELIPSPADPAAKQPVSNDVPRSKTLPPGVSVLLFPAIMRLFSNSAYRLSDVELIGVATGPGLFTGLRVGVVTAKSLAYVNEIPVVGVNTLEVIAVSTTAGLVASKQISSSETPVVRPVLNAQRKQLFVGAYAVRVGVCESLEPNQIVDRQTWVTSLKENDFVSGTGLTQFEPKLLADGKLGAANVVDSSMWNCSAADVAKLALQRFLAGKIDDLWTLQPFYFRPSAAEEVLKAKQLK